MVSGIIKRNWAMNDLLVKLADSQLFFDSRNMKILNSARLPNKYHTEIFNEGLKTFKEHQRLDFLAFCLYHVIYPEKFYKIYVGIGKLKKDL